MFYKLCFALSVLVVGPVGHAESQLTAEQGKALYDNYCQTCHGEDMVNPGTVSYDLRKFPEGSKSRFLESVSNGKNGMPSWKSVVTPEDMELLWLYVLTRGQ
jgi:mono/diheme cytochrome c family protein